jgi:hypothetical protein
MKKLVLISIVASLGCLPIQARASFEAKISENNIEISGECFSKDATVMLAKAETPEKIVYSGGVLCENGKFKFADDLLKWQMDDGKYNLMVNGKKIGKTVERNEKIMNVRDDSENSANQTGVIQPTVSAAEVSNENQINEITSENFASKNAISSDADAIFLQAFVSLQKSLLEMQERLPETKLPEIVKTSMDLILNGLQKLTGKITDILWSVDSGKTMQEIDSVEVEGVVLDKTIEKAKQNTMKNVEAEIDQKLKIPINIDEVDGLSVPVEANKNLENNDLIIEKDDFASTEVLLPE